MRAILKTRVIFFAFYFEEFSLNLCAARILERE